MWINSTIPLGQRPFPHRLRLLGEIPWYYLGNTAEIMCFMHAWKGKTLISYFPFWPLRLNPMALVNTYRSGVKLGSDRWISEAFIMGSSQYPSSSPLYFILDYLNWKSIETGFHEGLLYSLNVLGGAEERDVGGFGSFITGHVKMLHPWQLYSIVKGWSMSWNGNVLECCSTFLWGNI